MRRPGYQKQAPKSFSQKAQFLHKSPEKETAKPVMMPCNISKDSPNPCGIPHVTKTRQTQDSPELTQLAMPQP